MVRSLSSVGRTTKTSRKAKCVIRKWRLERFEDKRVKLKLKLMGFQKSFKIRWKEA